MMTTSVLVHLHRGDELKISAAIQAADTIAHPYTVLDIGPVHYFVHDAAQLLELAAVATSAARELLQEEIAK